MIPPLLGTGYRFECWVAGIRASSSEARAADDMVKDSIKAKRLSADGYIIKASAIPSEVLAETLRTIETGPSSTGKSG